MILLSILPIAVALGVDAMSLAISIGLAGIRRRQFFLVTAIVTVFHILMPLFGVSLGRYPVSYTHLTEVLVKAALEFAGQLANPQILELCTGSGVIAVSLAYYLPTALVTAVDISAPALEVAKANSVKYGVNGRVSFYQGDLFEPLVEGFKYDLLVANPPYISEAEYETLPADVKKEPALALLAGSDGLDYYRRIASRAAQFLLREGKLFLEIGWQQGEEVSQILKEAGFDEITVIADQAGRDLSLIHI